MNLKRVVQKNPGELQQSGRRVSMLVPAVRAPDLPFVNSVCCSHGGNLATRLMKSMQILT